MELGVDYLSDKVIEENAQIFLVENGLTDLIPVPIEETVEFKLGIDIILLPNLQRTYDIEGFTSSDLSCIYVDEFIYSNRHSRFRFTLAHEVGHIVLHRHIFEQVSFDSVENWMAFIGQIDRRDYSKLEYQGYEFARRVLVPSRHLQRHFDENLHEIERSIEKAQKAGLKRNKYLEYAIEEMASILAPIFDVSTDVIVKRIAKESLAQRIP